MVIVDAILSITKFVRQPPVVPLWKLSKSMNSVLFKKIVIGHSSADSVSWCLDSSFVDEAEDDSIRLQSFAGVLFVSGVCFFTAFCWKKCGHIVPKLGPAASPACGVNPKGEARGTGTPTPAWPVPGLPSICVQSSLSKPSSAKSWIFTPINIAFRKYSHHGKPKGHATKDGFVPLYWSVKCCSLVNCFAKVLQRLKVSKMLNSWSLVAETHSAW